MVKIIIMHDSIALDTLENWKGIWKTAVHIHADAMILLLWLFCFVGFWITKGTKNILDYHLGNKLQVKGCLVMLNIQGLEIITSIDYKYLRWCYKGNSIAGLWARSLVRGMQEATDHCFSCTWMLLSLSLLSPFSKNK